MKTDSLINGLQFIALSLALFHIFTRDLGDFIVAYDYWDPVAAQLTQYHISSALS